MICGPLSSPFTSLCRRQSGGTVLWLALTLCVRVLPHLAKRVPAAGQQVSTALQLCSLSWLLGGHHSMLHWCFLLHCPTMLNSVYTIIALVCVCCLVRAVHWQPVVEFLCCPLAYEFSLPAARVVLCWLSSLYLAAACHVVSELLVVRIKQPAWLCVRVYGAVSVALCSPLIWCVGRLC